MVLSTWTTPNIDAVLEPDIRTPIATNTDVNDGYGGHQFLFSDDRYYDQLHTYTLRSEEYGELNGNYDGYALYNKMNWLRVDSVQKQARGLFTEIPFRGFTGWICIYDTETYPAD